MDQQDPTIPSIQLSPRRRRNTSSGLGSFFKNTLGNAFLTFFEETMKTKPSVKQNEEMIKSNFKKINDIIDSVDEHIKKRMENYQSEVFDLIKDEISDMKVQTEKLVEQLNKKIAEKNVHNELWHIKNELDYFKIEALKLFELNKGYRVEIKLLKKQVKDLQIEIESQEMTMQKLRKKYMRQKLKSEKIALETFKSNSLNKTKKDDVFLTQTFGISKSQREAGKAQNPLFKEQKPKELSVVQDKGEEQSLVDIRISNNNNLPNHVNALLSYQQNLITSKSSLPSLQLRDSMFQNELPELPSVHMAKIESFICEQPVSMLEHKYYEKGVQTDPESKIKIKQQSLFHSTHQKIQSSQSKHKKNQKTFSQQLGFINRFSFNKNVFNKQKHIILQHSLRQRQTLRMRTEGEDNGPLSMRYMSNALIKNRLENFDSHEKKSAKK